MDEQILKKRDYKPRLMPHDISALKSRTRKIDHLKYTLPGIALAVLLIPVLWPWFRQWHYKSVPTLAQTVSSLQESNTATRPAYKGVDKNNQPYTISADQGLEISPEEIELSLPKMEMALKSGEKISLSASLGKYDKSANKLHLIGNVILTHSQGYTLETGQAWLDCNEGSAYTNNPVWGKGPLGAIQSKGFLLTERGNRVSFNGGAELYIASNKGKAE